MAEASGKSAKAVAEASGKSAEGLAEACDSEVNRMAKASENKANTVVRTANSANGRMFRTLLWLAGIFLTFALGIVIYTAQAVPEIRCDVRENSTRITGLEEDRIEITDKLDELDRTLDEHTRALDRIQDRLGIERPREAER